VQCNGGSHGSMHLGKGGFNTKVYNNTIFNVPKGIGLEHTYDGADIRNNIIWQVSGPSIDVEQPYPFTQSNNLCQSGFSGSGVLNGVNPLFNSTSDQHLQSTSPALNAGITLSAVPTDAGGTTRPQGLGWDIGAYER
jgi:hypothetical protein